MSIDEFFSKYDDKPLDWDGMYGNQCKDVFSYYNSEVVGCPYYIYGNASDLMNADTDEYYDKIYDNPQQGDVVVWGTGVGQWGHVAIYDRTNGSNFVSFDQNYPIGSPCHFQGHNNFNNIIGYLRPHKGDNMSLSKLDLVRDSIDWFYRTFLHVETEEELMSHVNNVMATFDQTTNGNSLRTELESMVKSDEFKGKWMLKADCKSDCSVQDQKIKDLEDAIILKTGQFDSETMQIEKEHAEFEKTANEEMEKRDDLISACKTNLTIATDGLKKCQDTQPPTIPVKGNWWQTVLDYFRNWNK